jgi:formamidopyrimidine-DNA glycosylase
MPELPEVESICKLLRSTLQGHPIESAAVTADPIVFKGVPQSGLEDHLAGNKATSVGRRGKFFWIDFEHGPSLLGHLGMSGWVQCLEPDAELPRFTKLAIRTRAHTIAFTDARRLGRLWLADDPRKDPQVARLGFDALEELPSPKVFAEKLKRRSGPIKGALLDQSFISGVGNYLADEILYHARISPKTTSADLTDEQIGRLRRNIVKILKTAVDADADENRFPPDWLFHHRWGGKRGPAKIGRYLIVREEVAGRTTAWVPALQSPKRES